MMKLNPMKSPRTPPQSATRDPIEYASSSFSVRMDGLSNLMKSWVVFGRVICSGLPTIWKSYLKACEAEMLKSNKFILYRLFYLVLHELTWFVTSKLIQLNSIHLFIFGQSFHKLKILMSMSAKGKFDFRGVYPQRFAPNFLTNFSLDTTPKRVIITCHTMRSSSVQ